MENKEMNKLQAVKANEEFNNGRMLIGEGSFYSLDDIKTRLNDNAIIVGGSGCGKSRNVVAPNIYEAVGSYIISDPKGVLYNNYADYLRLKGYKVRVLNFAHPENSNKYNPLANIRTTQEIIRITEVLINDKASSGTKADPYWDQITFTLLSSIIGYMKETQREPCDFSEIMELTRKGARTEEDTRESELANMFASWKKRCPKSWACAQFESANAAPDRTFDCIRSTLSSKFAKLDSRELQSMMKTGSFDFESIACEKTALFVIVSDTDRSMDILANIFFSQAINALCEFADNRCENGRLPIPVRMFLDDFATNVRIEEFPRIISSIRSRGLSAMLMVQSESQLTACYGLDDKTIISNCDTYAYIGGNDPDTAESISYRLDCPVGDILYMPIGDCIVFRRGSKPVRTKLLNGGEFIRKMEAVKEAVEMRRTYENRDISCVG